MFAFPLLPNNEAPGVREQVPVAKCKAHRAERPKLVFMNDERRIARITRRARGDPAARDYRIFFLDSSGKIVGSDVFPAADDAVAVVIARAMDGSSDRELWEAGRLIARLPAIAASGPS